LTVRKPNKSGVVAGLFRPCGSLAPPNSENLPATARRPDSLSCLAGPDAQGANLITTRLFGTKKKTTGFGFRFGALLRIGFPALARDFSGASEQVIY
jgi:hypothetical protein